MRCSPPNVDAVGHTRASDDRSRPATVACARDYTSGVSTSDLSLRLKVGPPGIGELLHDRNAKANEELVSSTSGTRWTRV
jgi:hypothetical protein